MGFRSIGISFCWAFVLTGFRSTGTKPPVNCTYFSSCITNLMYVLLCVWVALSFSLCCQMECKDLNNPRSSTYMFQLVLFWLALAEGGCGEPWQPHWPSAAIFGVKSVVCCVWLAERSHDGHQVNIGSSSHRPTRTVTTVWRVRADLFLEIDVLDHLRISSRRLIRTMVTVWQVHEDLFMKFRGPELFHRSNDERWEHLDSGPKQIV